MLSLAIIARDEERHIGAALESAAGLADELVVLVDDRTTDRTAEVCRAAGARVHVLPWTSFPRQRNRALELCAGTWVLFLDADERLTPELRAELAVLLAAPDDECVGYWIPRHNLYFGRPLRGGGWYPDHQLRLLRRERARYDEGRAVHELVQLDGPAGYLREHLLHINIERLAELREKERRYAIIRAQGLFAQGVRARWRNLLLQPAREVARRFVTWRGYRDGLLGRFLTLALGYYEWVCYVHLKALERCLARSEERQPTGWMGALDSKHATADPRDDLFDAADLDLSVIVVSWNVRDLLRRCLQSLERALAGAQLQAEIIVVDNQSSDGSPALVRAEFPQVRLVETGANLGYSGGVNAGLKVARGRLLFVINPDTEMVGDAPLVLARYLDEHPEVAVVGPQLRYPDGSTQSSRRRFPTLAMALWESTILARLWPGNPWGRRYRMEDSSHDAEQRVGWLVGAALLVRRADLLRAGPMDERFWMYSEELEWQRRLSAGGRAIVYLPRAEVVHHEGQSSAQVPARKHLAFQQSKLLYTRLAHGAAGALLLRLVLLAGYALEWALEALKWLLGHKRPMRRERMGVYGTVLAALARAQRRETRSGK